MTGLRVTLLVVLVVAAVEGVILLVAPGWLTGDEASPLSRALARYMGGLELGVATALWYAFRNPIKNVAVVRAALTILGLTALVALYSGMVGDETWGEALPTLIPAAVLAVAVAVFYPRGHRAT